MSRAARSLAHLKTLLDQQRQALLTGATTPLDTLTPRLQAAVAQAESASTGPAAAQLAEPLQAISQLATENQALIEATITGIRDAQALLRGAMDRTHNTYSADGSIETHALSVARLQKRT
ncbi:MAG: flagellar export chaperone FlgN [Pararhodobacter sp.]